MIKRGPSPRFCSRDAVKDRTKGIKVQVVEAVEAGRWEKQFYTAAAFRGQQWKSWKENKKGELFPVYPKSGDYGERREK